MYKYLFICFLMILQSCSSVKKVKIPTEYPISIHFTDPCCGTLSDKPICNFTYDFLRQNKILQIHLVFQKAINMDNSYTLFFPLNDLKEIHKNDFINGMKNIVSNIKPKTENEGNIVFTEVNKKVRFKKYKYLHWAYYSYDSTMNSSNWMNSKPLAGSSK
jgi:hypothetical protein